MIFKKLILHNFGIYKGRHEINLTPPSPGKPIVLFGGLNGGGKTTFLHAIQLALYGKFAGCVTHSSKGYETVLAEFINKDTNPKDGAAIELHVQHFIDGKEETIELYRSWKKPAKSVAVHFEVRKDGSKDQVMADRWYELVEGLLPSSLSNLFFFDGEKIQALADPAASSQFVKKGLHDLLGLDLVSTLISDLRINERRKLLPEVTAKEDQSKLDEAEKQYKELSEQKNEIESKCDALHEQINGIKEQEIKTKKQYGEMGGDLLDQRESILLERDRLALELHHVDQQLRVIAADIAPVLLVKPLIERCVQQAEKEQEIQTQTQVVRELESRDAQVLQVLHGAVSDPKIWAQLDKYLSEDRNRRANKATQSTVLDVSPLDLAMFSPDRLNELEQSISQLLNHRESVISRAEIVDRKLEGMPDPVGLEGISARLSEIEAKRIRKEVELNSMEEVFDRVSAAASRANDTLENLQNLQTELAFGKERWTKVFDVNRKAQTVLAEYQNRLASAHIEKLQDLILDSYSQLLRKRSLVDAIEIDPDTFEVALYDSTRRKVLPNRLSAGERQLLSVAILWGLAKASGRPIPTIIDTPLGRLDGSHRRKLVENYFPQAAHQVILLSTDEEIAGDLYQRLKPHIGHAYMLTFNEERATTEVTGGYEFRGAA